MMQPPNAAQLIAAWEQGLGQDPVQKALTFLAASFPNMSKEELACLSVSERETRLLGLRTSLFGPVLNSIADCPCCRTRVEFRMNVADLIDRDQQANRSTTNECLTGNYRLHFRPPDSRDLLAAAVCPDVPSARQMLLERCILEAHQNGKSVSVLSLPAHVINELASQLATLETQADNSIDLQCPCCSHQWQLTFDIVSFLWAEVDSLAKRLLRDVHALAWAYGWSQADILAMSAARRQFYLDLVD